ncbi:hypothetical protein [Metallosphaera yellowstonensis]|uniref:hypothetical protein n=1 Tax=Metallosphaera yellowstonensis TaxID=1111107 RepID=UPI0012DE7C59|nr:hypothetical protein [Metallosphaera yellowstonensis]
MPEVPRHFYFYLYGNGGVPGVLDTVVHLELALFPEQPQLTQKVGLQVETRGPFTLN